MALFRRQVMLAVVQWPPAGQIFEKCALEKTRADHTVKTAPPELKMEPYGASYGQKRFGEARPIVGTIFRENVSKTSCFIRSESRASFESGSTGSTTFHYKVVHGRQLAPQVPRAQGQDDGSSTNSLKLWAHVPATL